MFTDRPFEKAEVGDIFKNRLLNNRSVFASWLFSYFLLLLMPILISCIVYNKAQGIIENDMINANRENLYQTQQAIDKELEDMNKFILFVSFNKSFNQIFFQKDIKSFYMNDDFIKMTSELDFLKIVNDFSNDYYVYLKNTDMVLTMKSVRVPEVFYESKFRSSNSGYNNITYKKWYEMLKAGHRGDYVTLSDKNDNNLSKKRTILYFRSIPVSMDNSSEATVVVSLDENIFINHLQKAKFLDKGWGLVIDKSDQIIYSNMPTEEPLSIKFEMLPEDTGLLHYKINGQDVVISYITSSVENWKYVSIIPTKVFSMKLDYVKQLIISCVIFSILLGVLVAYLFSRKNYGPINDLILLINKKVKMTQGKGYNEYRFIRDAMNDVIDENESKNLRLEKQDIVLRSNFLMRLLKGRIEDNTMIFNSLKMYNLHFESENFAVMLFYIIDYNELFHDDDHYTSEEKLRLAQFIITNVVEELASIKNLGYITEVDQMLACIINFKDQDVTEGKNDMIYVAHETKEFILEKFHIDIRVSASSIHKTFIGISEAYQEALSVMQYKRVMDCEDIIVYDEIKNSVNKYNYSFEVEHQLINCIKAGEFENASSILNEVFENNFTKAAISNEMVKCLLFDLTGTILKTISEINTLYDDSFFMELNVAGKLLNCERVNEMKQQMDEILKEICFFINQNKKGKKENLIENAVIYIKNNYNKADLSVSDIAEKFELTPTYLTRLFKEKTGEGILDYIVKIRLDKAKLLLKNQQKGIKDVAIEVGYCSSTAFIRVFKKYEGITPGSYRDMNL